MSTILRALLGALVALALASAPAFPAAASAALATSAADSPSVAYKRIVKECSSYTMDGQEQKQCRADFTVAVTDIRKNYKVVVMARDPQHDMTTTVGRFTSDGTSARKRFHDVVISYGVPDDQTRVRFRVVVKNAAGEKGFTSRWRTSDQSICATPLDQ